VKLPISGKKVAAIDVQTKKELLEAINYLEGDVYSRKQEQIFAALADKYEIPTESRRSAIIAYINKLLDKTKSPETLPGTYTRKNTN